MCNDVYTRAQWELVLRRSTSDFTLDNSFEVGTCRGFLLSNRFDVGSVYSSYPLYLLQPAGHLSVNNLACLLTAVEGSFKAQDN